MKEKLYLLLLLALLALNSCYKDNSSDTYTASEVITITNIEPKYDAILGVKNLLIEPEVTSSIPNAKFKYKWEIYETNASGYVPKLEFLSDEKVLDMPINKKAKRWIVVFSATNVNTNYSKIITVPVDLATIFTRGWYVLKDNGVNSDIDLFQTPISILVTEKEPIENILLTTNQRQLQGKAGKLTMSSGYKVFSEETNSFKPTTALAISSSDDLCITEVSTMKIARDATDITYAPLSIIKPQCIHIGGMVDQYFVNDGKIHSISNSSGNSGIFGESKFIDSKGSDYYISKYVIPGAITMLTFDDISSSFVLGANGLYLTPCSNTPKSPISVNNNNLECLYMGNRGTGSSLNYTIYGVFRDKTTGGKGIYHLDAPYLKPFTFTLLKPLTSDDKASKAEIFTTSIHEDFIYFEADGQIWSCNVLNGVEKLEYSLPAGEKVAFLRNQECTNKAEETKYQYNYVIVGTNVGGKYIIRMFNKNAGSFDGDPIVVLNGNGNCGDIIYISPKYTTYAIPFL